MARTIEEIKKEMTDAFLADETLRLKYGFDPNKSFAEQFSKASLESIIFYIVAVSIWVLEKLFDKHQEEVSDTIAKRAHTLTWYREKALGFQLDFPLKTDVVEFDNEGKTENEIEQSKIVAKCSCESISDVFPKIKVKAVTANGAMTNEQKEKFETYMKEIADAGIILTVDSLNPDKIGLAIKIYYDPLLMDSNGNVAATNKTLSDYVNDYLSSLEYNGDFYPNLLEKYLMDCPGIKVANITAVWIKPENKQADDKTNLWKCSPVSGAFIYDNTIHEGLQSTLIPFTDEQ